MRDFRELIKAPVIRKIPTKVKVALCLNIFLIAGTLITAGGIYAISTHGFRVNYHINKHYLKAQGEITDAWIAKQEDSENDAIIAYEYIFFDSEIGQFSGTSYGTIIYPIGQPITVRYDPFNPHYNRATNLRVSKVAPLNWLQASGIILIGLSILLYWLLITLHRSMYLTRGQITWAYKVDKQHQGQQTDTASTWVYCFTDLKNKDRYLSKDYHKDEHVRRRVPVIYLADMTHKAQLPDDWKALEALSDYLMKILR